MLPSLPQHKLACLSRCMLGQPVTINMLPSLPRHMLGWPATACQDVCLAGLSLFCLLATCSTGLPQCQPATTYAQPTCFAGLPQCRPATIPYAWPACHNAGLPQSMLGRPITACDENPMTLGNSSAVTLGHSTCHCESP